MIFLCHGPLFIGQVSRIGNVLWEHLLRPVPGRAQLLGSLYILLMQEAEQGSMGCLL